MIKIIHVLVILFFSATLLQAQNPVPNPGFENWTAGNPDGWFTYNMGPGASPILQDFTPYAGTSAVRGEVILVGPVPFFPIFSSVDASANGFPVSQQYASLTFYYKTNISSTSYFGAYATIEDANGAGIGAGAMLFNGVTSTYTLANIPINYFGTNPAEAVIAFVINDSLGVPPVGNYFVVDEVALSGTVGMEEKEKLFTRIEKVQPNPAQTLSEIYYAVSKNEDVLFEMFDLTGRKHSQLQLRNEVAGRHKVEWDLSEFPSGSYMIRMITASGVHVAPLVVAH